MIASDLDKGGLQGVLTPDAQALLQSACPEAGAVGPEIDAGGLWRPVATRSIGRRRRKKSRPTLLAALERALDLIFIAAEMGGATGHQEPAPTSPKSRQDAAPQVGNRHQPLSASRGRSARSRRRTHCPGWLKQCRDTLIRPSQ